MTFQQVDTLVKDSAPMLASLAAIIVSLRTRDKTLGNTTRLNVLENGGGDSKIDARLLAHGLVQPLTKIAAEGTIPVKPIASKGYP